jgi:uncharacterized protein with HEPN domain
MIERDRKALERAIYHIEMIKEYMKHISTIDDFNNNSIVQDAVVFNFLQIGEIAKTRISDEIKKRNPLIPWNKLYGFRNRLVHDYTSIVLNVVYETIVEDLESLYNQLKSIL